MNLSIIIDLILCFLVFILPEIILFAFIKNKKIKYIGFFISILLNIYVRNYGFGYRLIIDLLILIIGIIFLIKQITSERKEKGIHTDYESSLGLRTVCFFIPLIGLIIYAVNIVQKPKIAKECGKFSLIGFIIGLLLSLTTSFIILFS